MPSYKLIPTESETVYSDALEERVKEQDGRQSDRSPKSGTIPDTFETGPKEMAWVEFGVERSYDRPTWDGTEPTIEVQRYPMFFLQNGYVAHHTATQAVMGDIQATIQCILASEIKLEPLSLNEAELGDVIDEAIRVQEAFVEPASHEDPDYLSAGDRHDLRDTSFWEDYQVDPFEKVRVELPGQDVDVDVGFDESGTLVLYGRSMRYDIQARALRSVTDEVIDRYVKETDFQGTIGRFGE